MSSKTKRRSLTNNKFMQSLIFYFSYLVFPFVVFLVFYVYKNRSELLKKKFFTSILLILFLGSSLFIYARFVERYVILTKTTEIEAGFSGKIVVVSDLHLGVYKNGKFLERIVEKVNGIEDVDAVLIPGDFMYRAPENAQELFSSLKGIKKPVYAVLGNHDQEEPGPEKLEEVFEKTGIIFLKNNSVVMEGRDIEILGLGDRWSDDDEISKIKEFSEKDNLIVMTHNPDTTLRYKNSIPDLTITGHAHGGQIRLPFVYEHAIPCTGKFDRGLYNTKNGKVFVSSGVGEIGLPMRLGIPPTIEVLELKKNLAHNK